MKTETLDRIGNVNLRPTTDQAFWGREYPDSVYLWEFSKHHLPIKLFDQTDAPTLDDPFSTTDSIRQAYEFCRQVTLRLLDTLARRLNRVHGLEYPPQFWRTVFGSWLYRHVSMVYDKFVCLGRIDLDRASLTLLDPAEYYVPNDHFDHLFYFCNDPGVMQLVSQYCALFAKKTFPTRRFPTPPARPYFTSDNPHASLIYADRSTREERSQEPNAPERRVALCCAYYAPRVLDEVFRRSEGEIFDMTLPRPAVRQKPLDRAGRAFLSRPWSDDPFERYLAATLECCLPKMLVEHFGDYHEEYCRHIRESPLSAIVTECWITFLPLTIYCALARQVNGTRVVIQHHGAHNQLQLGDMLWLNKEAADTFITTGWVDEVSNCVSGGFAVRDRIPYQFDEAKRDVVHAATTRFPYLSMCGATGWAGKRFLHYCRRVEEVMDNIPQRLLPHYVFRPRRDWLFLDTEFLWDLAAKNLRMEPERDFTDLIHGARLIVIDHMSTGLAEIACDRIPFLYLYDDQFERLDDRHAHVFDALMACGVVHATPASLLAQLDRIYDDVRGWWESPPVRAALDAFLEENLREPGRTVDYLLSLAPRS